MKIKTFDIYQYSVPLRSPLTVHETTIETREGFIVHLTSDHGGHGFGEVAPLPGVSIENLKQTLIQLKLLKADFTGHTLPPKLETLNGEFAKLFKNYHLKSSVQFGMETAILNLMASVKNIPLYKMIGHEDTHELVEVNGLLFGPTESVAKEAHDLMKNGFHSVKLKVGNKNIHKDVEKVREVNAALEEKAILRLDANQQWDLELATEFALEIGAAATEYIEEPFPNFEAIGEFFNETLIPVALDETLAKVKIADIKSIDGLEVIVIKPTMLGGIEKSWQIVNEAKSFGMRAVISSSFESGIGISTLANIAGCTNRYSPAGLDTLKWFKEDLINNPLTLNHGKMDISKSIIEPKNINFDHLKIIKD